LPDPTITNAAPTRTGVPVLEIEGLTVEFASAAGAVRAVEDLSMRLHGGETVAVVGESGCGKSVTSLAAMGLLPAAVARVAAGRVLLRRRAGGITDLLKLPRGAMADIRGDEIAIVFQEPMTSLNPLQPVGQQIAESLLLHRGLRQGRALDRVCDLLAQVGIAEPRGRLGAYPHELSGGMRQRVMIAIALACEPAVLIADEPTTALDVTIQAQILALLRDLQSRLGMALLFVTHDLGVVAEIAHRVVVMYAGQVVEEGPVADVLMRPLHPYTAGLIASIPRIDRPRRGERRFHAIPGQVPVPGHAPPGCRFRPRCAHAVPACEAPLPLKVADPDRTVRCVRWRELAHG
jgi:oligopeptide/dipeptide ABC transporter ATP-binding protein